MLDQTIANLLTTALGGMLVITGGLVATVATQALNNKAERNKFRREKCEEVYLLAVQIKEWVKNEDNRWWQNYYDDFFPNAYPDSYRREYKQLDCPIDTLLMIVRLHLPELYEKAKALKKSVDSYQYYDSYSQEEGWHAFSDDIETTLKDELRKFKNSYIEFQKLIEKIILESWGIRSSKIEWWKKNILFFKRILQRLHPRKIK